MLLELTIIVPTILSTKSSIDESIFPHSIDCLSQQEIPAIADRIQNKLITNKEQYFVMTSENGGKF